ncbi:hypothetical protein BSL78_19834 [Apostichopus japonicus]|uniref:Uncharacterized protein n=1 Tax=Stichopus japonicus TaxID=307972 RepID=A0A2G8K5M1_STIJA|nr:hypothetical protein BSL78_19834 [Apostichopus japonicus]
MEDTYELNVVTESPQCLAKCNESDNSFQLVCYTVNPNGQSALQTWEIIESGDNSKTFTDFAVQQRQSQSVTKIVGISNTKVTKENITGLYKCSLSNDRSRNCSFNFESLINIEVSRPTIITSDFPTHQRHKMSSLRHTSTPPTSLTTSEKPVKKWIIIIVAVTVSLLFVSVCLTIMICKTKGRFFCKGRKVNDTHKKGDLVQTGTVLGKLSDNANQEIPSYDEIQRKSERGSMKDKHNRSTMNSEGNIPEDLYNKVEKRSLRHDVRQTTSHEIKDNTNRSHIMNSEGKVPEDLDTKVEKRGVRHDVRQSTSNGKEENKHKSNTKNDEDEVPDDLYAKVKKVFPRYQANQLRDSRCEPYSIVDIDKLTFQDENFQDDSPINTTDMVDCSVYEPFEADKTEKEIHYCVLDPSKDDALV